MEAPLKLTVNRANGGVHVQAEGEIDLYSSEHMRNALAAAFELGDECLLDLREVTFIDSTGLARLLRDRANAMLRGQRLRVTYMPDGPIATVVRVAGLEGALPDEPWI